MAYRHEIVLRRKRARSLECHAFVMDERGGIDEDRTLVIMCSQK